MDFWQQYRAIDARDERFDGQFVTAVHTTGIYCRPSCPARTPKPSNVTFYRTSAAAHEAGYRACKRCLPEAVPGTPEWDVRGDIAARAMRLINTGFVNEFGVDGLASELGYSSRQLGRILRAELGAGALSLARAQRAQTARTLITSTDMLLADVAFAAGFSSVRQFNDTLQEIFDLSPSEIRARATERRQTQRHSRGGLGPGPASSIGPDGTILSTTAWHHLGLRLTVRAPYDRGIFSYLAARSIPGIEWSSPEIPDAAYARSMRLRHGAAIWCVAHPGGRGTALNMPLEVWIENLADLPELLGNVRRILDADADPTAVDAHLRGVPGLAEHVDAYPGTRVPGAADGTEILMRAMIGQQITVKAALNQLAALSVLGSPVPALPHVRVGTIDRLFPTAQAIAEHGFDILRGPLRRREAIVGAAAKIASGEVHVSVADDYRSLREKLLPLPGIGEWTVKYVAMRLTGDPDICMDTDVALNNGLRTFSSATPTQFLEKASPWRSYAQIHLWRLATPSPRAPMVSTTRSSKNGEKK